MIAHHATVLHVQDLMLNKEFFEKLGFIISFVWGEPIDYMVMKAGETSIHLSKANRPHTNSGQTDIYFFVSDIEKYYEGLNSKGMVGLSPLVDQEYGMKDFDLVSPDGYNLSFGQGK